SSPPTTRKCVNACAPGWRNSRRRLPARSKKRCAAAICRKAMRSAAVSSSPPTYKACYFGRRFRTIPRAFLRWRSLTTACTRYAIALAVEPGLQKLLDERVLALAQLGRCRVLDDVAVVQERDFVGHPQRRGDVVADDHARDAEVLLRGEDHFVDVG